MNSKYFPLVFLVFLLSCAKDKTPPIDPVSESPVLNFKFHHKAGTAAFSFDAIHTDDFGTKFKFTRASIYISRPTFLGHTPTDTVFKSDTYMLVTPAQGLYAIGDVVAGHYHEMTFGIGVDSVANHSDPATYPPSHALAYQNPSTHWNWSSGYIFTILEGKYDGDNNGVIDGTDPTFSYHIGTNPLYRKQPHLIVHSDIADDNTYTFEFSIDYLKFLDGIDIKTEDVTHSLTNFSLAKKIADNAVNVITAH